MSRNPLLSLAPQINDPEVPSPALPAPAKVPVLLSMYSLIFNCAIPNGTLIVMNGLNQPNPYGLTPQLIPNLACDSAKVLEEVNPSPTTTLPLMNSEGPIAPVTASHVNSALSVALHEI